jgi:N-acetyl-anhydromuramyl-L-alanine amidase AmpD
MGSWRGQCLALCAVLSLAAAGASTSWAASLSVLIRHTPNKTESNRTAKTIAGIVIHDTEGRFIGSIRTLQNPRTDGSAHFVVSRLGQIVQLVPVGDVAWHSGNAYWNLHSIGIEHEGWVGRRAYTEAEYRASAQLVAYLAHRWGVPLDRRHIIGHNEVPNPNHPGRFGGVSGHTDPGRYWNWGHYMYLVRYFTSHRVMPHFVKRMTLRSSPVPGAVRARPSSRAHVLARTTVGRGTKLRGKAVWWSGIDLNTRWRRHIWKVDFMVDGRTLYTDHTWPFSFHRTIGWDTSTVANGSHMLAVRAYGTQHYRVRKSIPVRVANPPMTLTVTGAGSGSGGAVSGLLSLAVSASEPLERVSLSAGGRPVSRDGSAPYGLSWDTTQQSEGTHSLLVYATGEHGHRAALRVPVIVANAASFPPVLASSTWSGGAFIDRD